MTLLLSTFSGLLLLSTVVFILCVFSYFAYHIILGVLRLCDVDTSEIEDKVKSVVEKFMGGI